MQIVLKKPKGIIRNGLVAEYRFDKRNLLKYSEDFTNAIWSKTRATLTTTTDNTPLDSNKVVGVLNKVANSQWDNMGQLSIPSLINLNYTLWAIVKPDTLRKATLTLVSTPNDSRVRFDLDAKTFEQISPYTGGFVQASIKELTNGYFLISLTTKAAFSTISAYIYPGDGEATAPLGSIKIAAIDLNYGDNILEHELNTDNQLIIDNSGKGNICTNKITDWELGSINATDGTNSPGTTRYRVKDFLDVLPNTSYLVNCDFTKYQIAYNEYTAAGVHVFNSGWLATSIVIKCSATTSKIRFIIRKLDDSNMVSTDVVNSLPSLMQGSHVTLGSTTGTDTNDPTWTGQGLNFNTDDYAEGTDLRLEGDYSLEAVFQPSASINTSGYIVAKNLTGTTDIQYGLYFSYPENRVNFVVGGQLLTTVNNSIMPGNFYHITVRFFKNNYTEIYINGNLAVGSAFPYGVAGVASKMQIGRRLPANVNFNGVISCINLYNRVLTPAEIKNNYRNIKQKMLQRGVILP